MDGENDSAIIFIQKVASAGIPLDYWKREKSSNGIFQNVEYQFSLDQSQRVDVKGLLSRSRALVNLSLTQNRETFLLEVDGT